MFGWLKRLFHTAKWKHAEYEREYRVAKKVGLLTDIQSDGQGKSVLRVRVPNVFHIGAIMLVGRGEKVIIHRSPKRKGYWQASWFKEGLISGIDKQYRKLQHALDRVRERGYFIDSIMTSDGKGKLPR